MELKQADESSFGQKRVSSRLM